MQYCIETDSGHKLVLEGIDQLTFAAGSAEATYEQVQTSVTDEISGRTSRTDLQAAVLGVVSQEVLEVSHIDIRELHVLLDVVGDDIDGPLQIVLEPREAGVAEQRASSTEREGTPDERAAQTASSEGPPDERAGSEATRETVEAEPVDGRPVIPLQETIDFAREHYATFQSALDMLDQMYEDVETGADYRMEPA